MKVSIKVGLFLTVLILFSFFVNAQQVVQVAQEQPVEEKHWYDFLTNPLFWIALLGIGFLGLLGIGAVIIIYYIIKWLKERQDIFLKIKEERITMAKAHRRYNSNHWFRVEKNTPIRMVRKDGDKTFISNPIAYHRGDFTTQEGNIIISLNVIGKKKWFVLPDTDLLIIPDREQTEIYKGLDDRGKPIIETIKNLPKAKDIVQFNENEILIYAESLSFAGHFIIPVIKTKDGKIMDLSMPTYAEIKEVAIHNYLYEQTDEFTKVAKKSMDINPNLRYEQKVRDSSQSVDVPPQDNRGVQ